MEYLIWNLRKIAAVIKARFINEFLNLYNGGQNIFIILHNCFSPDLSSVYIQSKLELEIIDENSFILAYFFWWTLSRS